MKSPDHNQEEGNSPSLKSEPRKTTEYAQILETPDRKPRFTKGYSSKKKTSLTGLKGLKTQDRFEDVSTNFNADQQDSLVDASDVANNSQNEPIKVKNELINDNKLKRGRAAHSVSPKKHRVGDATDRRRTVAEYPQSTANTNQKLLLKNKTPDRKNLKCLSLKEKKLLESATSRRTTVDRSEESSSGNTQNARNFHRNIDNRQSSPNDSFDDENTVANNYIETSPEDVNCAGPSKDIDSSVDDFDLLDRAKDIRTVKKTCLSVSSKKRSLKNSSNRRKTVAEYPQSESKIVSDLFEDSGIHQQNVDDGELLGRKSLKLTDADLKTPIKKPKNTRTVSLKKPTPLRTSKGRRTVGDFGGRNYQKFDSANTSNQPFAVECSIEDSLVDESVSGELHNMNNSQNEDNSAELRHNLSNDEDLFANVHDNNVIKNRRMCHSVSPQKPSLRDSTNRRKTVAQYPQLSVGLDQSEANKSYLNKHSDRQESDYSEVLANVSLNQPLRRRKGYSLNMRKATLFDSRRKTLGAQTKTPKVKSWKNLFRFTQQSKNAFPLSRRATSNFTSISLPASSASRRSFTDVNLKKIVPKVDEWKTETITITPTTIGSEEPKSAHTSRKIENKLPIKSDPNQLDLESEEAKILNKPVEALRRTTRKRAVSKEILELVEEPTKITPKRNTRRAKINENIDVNDDGLLEKPKKVVGTRKGRGKRTVTEDKVVVDQIKINTSTNVNAETPQLTTQDENGTKSLVEMQIPVENSVGLTEKKTGKRNLSKEDVREIDDQVKISSVEVPTKATKKRKLNKNDLQESAVDTPTLSESAQTVRSTRKLVKEDSATPVQNSPVVAGRVTRKRNIVQEASDLETEENIKSTRGKTKSEPAKSRRGRSNKINNSEAVKVVDDKTKQSSVSGNEKNVTEEPIPESVIPKRPTKGRKAVVKKTDKSPILAEAPVAQIVLEQVKAEGDSTRGRKVVTENIAVLAEEAVAEVELEQAKPKRATRGRKAITKNIEETPVEELVAEKCLEPVKPKNSTRRKAVLKNIPETVVLDEAANVEDLEPVEPKKLTRGRKAVLKNISETPGEDLDQAPIVPKKTTRGKKAVAENASPLVEGPVAVEDAKLNKPKKTTRGKKAVSENTEETVVNQVPSEESVQPKRSARGRRAIQADAAIDKEPVAADEPIAVPKVSFNKHFFGLLAFEK